MNLVVEFARRLVAVQAGESHHALQLVAVIVQVPTGIKVRPALLPHQRQRRVIVRGGLRERKPRIFFWVGVSAVVLAEKHRDAEARDAEFVQRGRDVFGHTAQVLGHHRRLA